MSRNFGIREAKEIRLLEDIALETSATSPDAYVASAPEYIGGFDKVAFRIDGTAVAANGGGSFFIQIADQPVPDKSHLWTTYGRLIDMDGSASQAKVEIVGNEPKVVFFAANDYASYVRVLGTANTNGSYTVTLMATA